MSSPWMVMRLMGQVYGYAAATMPMIGQVKTEEKMGSRWVEEMVAIYWLIYPCGSQWQVG